MRDLEQGPARGLSWDLDAALEAIAFYREVLRLNGGEFEGAVFELGDWQVFIVGSIFGWKGSDGWRRFRVVYVETAKGSGKSPLAAGVGLKGLVADDEDRAEIYAGATKKDQAMVLFRDAVAMVRLSPELSARIYISGRGERAHNLAYRDGNFFKPISADDGQSGPRPHIALIDEVHEHKTATVIEMLRAGTKNRRQALIFMITNSGTDKHSVCWHYHQYSIDVAGGILEDDSFFGYVCALDTGDDPFKDEACWGKANPSLALGIPGMKYLREQVTQARGMPSKESIVRRLNFCEWVESENPAFSREKWEACDGSYALEELHGRPCYGGLDLSSTTDLTAFVLAFPPVEEGQPLLLLAWFWIPDEDIKGREEKDRVPYGMWIKQGHLETTPGPAIKKLYVLQRIAQITAGLDLRELAYDRWRIEDFKALCDDEGIALPMVQFGQGFKDMAPAVDEFERLLVNGEMRHPCNPVLTWCIANSVFDEDPAGNRKITKERSNGRVDGAVAGVMAIGRVILKAQPTEYHVMVL